LNTAGLQVDEIELPIAFREAPDTHARITRGESRSSFMSDYRAHPSQLHHNIRIQVESPSQGHKLSMAYDAAAGYRASFDELASSHDAILTPSAVGEALVVALTDTGRSLQSDVQRLFDQLDQSLRRARAASANQVFRLSIGLGGIHERAVRTPALMRLQPLYPDSKVERHEMNGAQRVAALPEHR
jgi:hypothetical protein